MELFAFRVPLPFSARLALASKFGGACERAADPDRERFAEQDAVPGGIPFVERMIPQSSPTSSVDLDRSTTLPEGEQRRGSLNQRRCPCDPVNRDPLFLI